MDDGTHAIGVTVFPPTEGSAEAPGAPPEVVGGAEGDTVERDAGKQKRMAFPGTFEAALQWAKGTLPKAGYKAPTKEELEPLFKEHHRSTMSWGAAVSRGGTIPAFPFKSEVFL